MEPIDRARAESAIREFLAALGRDPSREPDLIGTPERVVGAYANELLAGYSVDVKALLGEGQAVAPGKLSGVVALRGVSVSTVCPHHLLLSHGSATVAYRPGDRLFGLGTLAELVSAYARRLSLQETIGESVARALVEHGGAVGAFCEVRLVHGCVVARGSKQAHSELVTTAFAGELSSADVALLLSHRPEVAP